MMTNPTTITNNHPTLATVCGNCGIEERKLLHHVCLRGHFKRLCTTCVLRQHINFFCPTCLGVYERLPPSDTVVVCYKCYSNSHPSCVSSSNPAPNPPNRGPSPCSVCLNPNSLVLNLNRVENGTRSGGRAIDSNAARLLLAAGKIAAMSMSKAEAAQAAEAEKRAREAAYTKKRAREALDHVVYLMAKEKRTTIDNSNKKVSNPNNANGIVVVNTNTKVDTSSEVLEALNAVELKERVVVSEAQGNGNGAVVMEVDDKDSVVNSVAENGSGITDQSMCNGLVSSVGQEQQGLEENNVSSLKH